MVKVLKPKLRTMDTRIARPPEKEADAELRTPEHAEWARFVIRRAEYRCEAIKADGNRCEVRAPATLYADHIMERKDGGALLDPENGRCLCASHHTVKTVKARAARFGIR